MMNSVRITYDPEGDILYVTFGVPTPATGYQLSDQVLLRVNSETREAAGLTIFNYSVHARSGNDMLLPGLEDLPEEKSHLMSVIGSPPVSHYLLVLTGDPITRVVLLSPSLPEAVAV